MPQQICSLCCKTCHTKCCVHWVLLHIRDVVDLVKWTKSSLAFSHVANSHFPASLPYIHLKVGFLVSFQTCYITLGILDSFKKKRKKKLFAIDGSFLFSSEAWLCIRLVYSVIILKTLQVINEQQSLQRIMLCTPWEVKWLPVIGCFIKEAVKVNIFLQCSVSWHSTASSVANLIYQLKFRYL